MNIRRPHHIQIAIPVGGEERARGFFGELLGLRVVAKPANLAVRGGGWYQVGDDQLHLGVESEFRPANKAHPAFEVSDLKAPRERFSVAGLEAWQGEPLEGFGRVYTRDPFGNHIEFLKPLP